jgi:hypothetical protein
MCLQLLSVIEVYDTASLCGQIERPCQAQFLGCHEQTDGRLNHFVPQ